jgi:hypothetical protein
MTPRAAALVLGLLAWHAAPLDAQGGAGRQLDVAGRRDLDFGTLVAGVSASVAPDVGGLFLARGTKEAEVQIQLTLPAALVGPGGSAPIAFGPTDGAHGASPSFGAATVFDPRLPVTAVLSKGGKYYIWLGGTISPPSQLTGGEYTATIVLTATYTGN